VIGAPGAEELDVWVLIAAELVCVLAWALVGGWLPIVAALVAGVGLLLAAVA
jgi:hypothetical protein